ncbi:MAG: hypothetical protein PHE78_08460 [Candidatus Gastranaerophilales bacterium]|nr:hypothetical protein [Candidatus Gastranaerophilales bacterium]
MSIKKGSAILIVLAVIALLLIISTFVMQSKTQRAAFTRYMSNEKKVEAVAEAVLDMALAKIKLEANKKDTPFYKYLRTECSTVNGKLNNGEKNALMTLSVDPEGIGPQYYQDALNAITTGDVGTFTVSEVSAEIVHAEAFGEKTDSYEVVGITIPPKTSSAKGSGSFPNQEASPNNDWRLPFHYPPYKDNKGDFENVWNKPGQALLESGFAYRSPDITVKLHFKGLLAKIVAELGGLSDKLDVNLLLKHAQSKINSDTAVEFGIKLEDKFIDKINGMIKKYNDGILSFFTGDLDYLSTESINELIKEAMDGENVIDIEDILLEKLDDFKPLKPEISPRSLQKLVMGKQINPFLPKSETKSLPPKFIEKGALLQLSCNVQYRPNNSQAILNKTFRAEIPFKVSDVLPIAPEYTFFIANSNLLGTPGSGLPSKIDFNCKDGGKPPVFAVEDAFMLHNMNHEQYPIDDTITISYDQVQSLTPRAGKIRVNGSNIEPVFLFAGALDGIKASELTALALSEQENSKRDLQLKATFGWYQIMNDVSKLTKQVKIHFPILRTTPELDANADFQTAKEKTISGIYEMYRQDKFTDIFTKPSLLYGYGHMDYPLGNKIEGKVGAYVSELFGIAEVDDKIEIDIKLELGSAPKVNPHYEPWDKNIQTYFGIKNITRYPNGKLIPYGMPNISQYNQIDETWANPDAKCMPTNCYSDLQYQKKATS